MNPLVSIILTTYNRDYIVSHAIDSVLKQTYDNYELLVIDDGSTDETAHLIHPILKAYPDKIKYYFKKNGGLVSALNHGLSVANGKYVGFIDSDDRYKPHHIETHVRTIIENDLKFTMGSFELIHQGPEPQVIDYFNPHQTIPFHQVEALTGTMFGDLKTFKDLGGFQHKLVDIDFFVRLKASKYRWAKVDTPTYEYYYGVCNDSILIEYTKNI